MKESFYLQIMKRFQSVFFLALALSVSLLRAETTDVRTIEITANDMMKFSVKKIEAHPGEKITVELKNEGTIPKEAMGHNWILLKAGVNPMVYANQAMSAQAENYQPKAAADKVIASISLLGPKESGKVSFTVPSEPGSYSYLCSFPGHAGAGMVGVLVVK